MTSNSDIDIEFVHSPDAGRVRVTVDGECVSDTGNDDFATRLRGMIARSDAPTDDMIQIAGRLRRVADALDASSSQ